MTSTTPIKAKAPDESAAFLRVPMYESQVDSKGEVLPDIVLKLIDVAGCIPPKRHLGPHMDPVTASIEHMDFWAPAHAWDILVLDSRLTKVWNTSMESRVVVTAWSFRTGEQRAIASAYLISVATKNNAQERVSGEDIPALLAITPEDNLLAASADRRKQHRRYENERSQWVPIDDALDHPIILSSPMTSSDSNGLGRNIFGGVILTHVYQAAQQCIERLLGTQPFVCVRQDRIDFMKPALIGDWLIAKAVVSRTWKTSIEVQVDCLAGMSTGSPLRHVASTYFVFVGLSEPGVPAAVPTFEPAYPHQEERAAGADLRRHMRKEAQTLFQNSL